MAGAVLRELAIGSRGTVLLFLPSGAAPEDPDPAATLDRDISLLCPVASATPDDIVDAIEALGVQPGVAGWSTGGLTALALAARRPDLVGRIAIIGTAAAREEPAPTASSASVEVDPRLVLAKTLLVYGGSTPDATSANGRWWQRALPDARLEMTPDAGDRLLELRWARVLAHLAPRAAGAAGASRTTAT